MAILPRRPLHLKQLGLQILVVVTHHQVRTVQHLQVLVLKDVLAFDCVALLHSLLVAESVGRKRAWVVERIVEVGSVAHVNLG